ncbi:hypothetical protein PMAC_002795 [Pneumocystis sp. 'macacae']|nr:hypothetical protein PMAC_002795 [Pneumocystis sp. 'macacae']
MWGKCGVRQRRGCLRGICVDFDEIWRRKEWNKRFFPACQGQRGESVHEVGRGERGRHERCARC